MEDWWCSRRRLCEISSISAVRPAFPCDGDGDPHSSEGEGLGLGGDPDTFSGLDMVFVLVCVFVRLVGCLFVCLFFFFLFFFSLN